ncbi:MAG TPA: flagellar hook-length control protein FliK [Ignavibacteriales bacterium]|mgnify:CR=1 FL=1|nr:flagellar hook-length control protein FliK [Ignavibacteriales bacterium]HOL80698.1 flagellar hook-length control protein FliK [Ignavibacteriales bacterium]HOM64385.1 flagellar hook-length control protein FliK [Ignavibacteriales bacterium]HPD67173.1 flagellar hook-length control protein FliK [Ignavibacteriales bacterium]HPP32969.1 flagellar hook-length control protein FliK [Ignavibacteriales bacterium]
MQINPLIAVQNENLLGFNSILADPSNNDFAKVFNTFLAVNQLETSSTNTVLLSSEFSNVTPSYIEPNTVFNLSNFSQKISNINSFNLNKIDNIDNLSVISDKIITKNEIENIILFIKNNLEDIKEISLNGKLLPIEKIDNLFDLENLEEGDTLNIVFPNLFINLTVINDYVKIGYISNTQNGDKLGDSFNKIISKFDLQENTNSTITSQLVDTNYDMNELNNFNNFANDAIKENNLKDLDNNSKIGQDTKTKLSSEELKDLVKNFAGEKPNNNAKVVDYNPIQNAEVETKLTSEELKELAKNVKSEIQNKNQIITDYEIIQGETLKDKISSDKINELTNIKNNAAENGQLLNSNNKNGDIKVSLNNTTENSNDIKNKINNINIAKESQSAELVDNKDNDLNIEKITKVEVNKQNEIADDKEFIEIKSSGEIKIAANKTHFSTSSSKVDNEKIESQKLTEINNDMFDTKKAGENLSKDLKETIENKLTSNKPIENPNLKETRRTFENNIHNQDAKSPVNNESKLANESFANNNNLFDKKFDDKKAEFFENSIKTQINFDFKNYFDEIKETKTNNLSNNNSFIYKNVKAYEIIREINHFVTSRQAKQLVLQIEPERLGKMKVGIEVYNNTVRANVEVENETVKRMIENNQNLLKESLAQQGLQLVGFSISLSSNNEKSGSGLLQNNKKNHKKFNLKDELNSKDEVAEVDLTATKKKMGYNSYEYIV